MEESKNTNSQNKSSEFHEQLQSSQSNKKISNNDINNNSNSTSPNHISSPHSNNYSIKEENIQSNNLSSHHSQKNQKNDSLEEQLNDLQNNDNSAAISDNYSASTNISDINIISDVSGEIIPKNKLLKIFREEHNNKIKKTKRILRDADYRHAKYNSHKKSRSSRSKTGSSPNLDSNKAIISSIPESIKQSPGNNVVNDEKNEEEEVIKEKSVSIGSIINQDNKKSNSLNSNENNSPKSPKSNKSFSSHTSKFTNDKASPGQLQENNSLENIASYNNSTQSEEISHHHKHHSKRKRKRPHLVLSPVQCNNFFSNSNTTPDNKIKTRSINGNNINLSPSDGQNFQFTPPTKLNSNGSKAKNDNMKNNKTKLETHFSSNLMHNSSIDFETVNAAPNELPSLSSFVTEPAAADNVSSLLTTERGIGFPIKDTSLSEVSLNFNTESLNFSQSEDFYTDNNSKLNSSLKNESNSNLKNKHNTSNISNPKSKSSHVSIKSNSDINHKNSNLQIERNRSSSHKSNSIIERNIPHISDKEVVDTYSNNASNLYTYTYETIDFSDSKSWTYMSVYEYEYEDDEDNNKNDKMKNENDKKKPSNTESQINREAKIDEEKFQSRSSKRESENENERSSRNKSYSSIIEREAEKGSENEKSDKIRSHSSNRESENERSGKSRSHSSIIEREVERGSENERNARNRESGSEKSSKHQSHSFIKEGENEHQSFSSIKEREVEKGSERNSLHQSQSGIKESENDKSPKHSSHSFTKESENDKSPKHQSHSFTKESDLERSRQSEKSLHSQHSKNQSENSKQQNDRSFDSKGSSPRSRKHPSSSSDISNSQKSTPIKSPSNSKLKSDEIVDIKERGIEINMPPSPRIQEIKRGIQREIERLNNSPHNIVSTEKVASTSERNSSEFSPRASNSKLSNSNSDKKESDFHFESENGHQRNQQPLSKNVKRNLNTSLHSNSVASQESFTEIFDKCHTEDQSSCVQPNMNSNNYSTESSERIPLSSKKAVNVSHISESCDEDPNSIRNISQIPNDALKRALPNPSKDLIISLSESESENGDKDERTEQSLSLASSENASQLLSSSSSSSSSASKKKMMMKKEAALVKKSSSKGQIAHEIRSFSINDIEKIVEEEEVAEPENPSSTSSIKPRRIDFASGTASSYSSSNGQKRIQNRSGGQIADQNLRNREISPPNSPSPLKSKETEKLKKPIFPAFNLPSSSSASPRVRSPHSFTSLGRMVLNDEEEEENGGSANRKSGSHRSGSDFLSTSDSSSLFNSPSISPFNTLRVTIVEVRTEGELADLSVRMFVHSDPRNVAETDVSKATSDRHVFRETFNVLLDGLGEKNDLENSNGLIDENIISDLCVLVSRQREVVARTTIPISTVTFRVGKKVDRWYQLVPNGQIRIIALAVDQENRSVASSRNSFSSNNGNNNSNNNSGSNSNLISNPKNTNNFPINLDTSYKNPNFGDSSNGSFDLNQAENYANPNLDGRSSTKNRKNSNSKEGSGLNLNSASSNNEVDEIELDVDVDVAIGKKNGNEENEQKNSLRQKL